MLVAAIVKDFHLLLRDRGAVGSLFLLPIIFIAVFGSMFSGDDAAAARLVPAYYATDHAAAADIAAFIERSGQFRLRREESPDRVRDLVAREKHRVGLIIPRDFDPAAGRPAELVIDEAASPVFRAPIEGAMDGLIRAAVLRDKLGPDAARPVIESRTPPGIKRPFAGADGFQLAVPGNAVLFGFFLALTVALSFVEERKSGTWRRLLAAPARRPTLLLAKLVPYFVIGLIQMAFLFGVGAVAFGMRVAGSVPALILLTFAVVFCATALGLFIAAFGGTEKQVGGIGSICLLVMGLLGGAMIPRMVMPEAMQQIGLLVPHAWALDGYYDVLIRDGATVVDVVRQIATVVGFGVVFAVIGVARFRFER